MLEKTLAKAVSHISDTLMLERERIEAIVDRYGEASIKIGFKIEQQAPQQYALAGKVSYVVEKREAQFLDKVVENQLGLFEGEKDEKKRSRSVSG